MTDHSHKKQLKPFEKALHTLAVHPLLGPVKREISVYEGSRFHLRFAVPLPKDAYCRLQGDRTVVFNDELKLQEEEWLGVFSIACLALALDAPTLLKAPDAASDLAAQLAALHWWRAIKLGRLPERLEPPEEVAALGKLGLKEIVQRLEVDRATLNQGKKWSLAGSSDFPWITHEKRSLSIYTAANQPSPAKCFVEALVENAKRTLAAQQDPRILLSTDHAPSQSAAAKAKRWLISHYPLLGSLLSQFDVLENAALCQHMHISIAAINVRLGEIYVNPLRALTFENAKFVLAHEVLHAGLSHNRRRQGRDPLLWNVACDFVINDWLVSMGVGIAPDAGLLFDEELRGWAAEDIYLRLASDLRIRRKLHTLRGQEVDMLDDVALGGFTDKEEFYRQALLQGLDYHQAQGRGCLPAGLVEDIRTLNQAPIPWQAKLAEWLREHFPVPERQRTYARPSRRQSATPDIARPRFYEPEQERSTRTFGVVLDTSGSMTREVLGMAIGTVVSYSLAQGVKVVRLMYCDATPYDEGYVEVASLVHRVRVRGRGGTQLQPAISLLEGQRDFPKEAPILVITDGLCEERLELHRDHAFLLSPGHRLPFVTRKPVFYMG